MEIRITGLKQEFNNISLIRNKIIHVFEILKNKTDKIKLMYSDFIKNNKSQLFIFGLDSFHFQSKLIDLEYDDMKRMFLSINNRMYCEYFKLYKIVVSYISDNITDKKILEIIKGNNFPIYKDLEPFKDYKFETIFEIHDNILILLNSLSSIISNRENELMIHKSNQLIGLNIDNFVNTFNFEIVIMKEKINLFLTYIEFFHKLHEKYLTRFTNKIVLMLNHINSDIHLDDNIENNSNVLDEEIKINEMDIFNSNLNSNDSGLTSPSSKSGNSTFKIPKIIKNGFKTVNKIINSYNSNNNMTKQKNNNSNIDLLNFDDLYDNSDNSNLIYNENIDVNNDNLSNYIDVNNDNLLNEINDDNENNNININVNEIIVKSDNEISENTNYDDVSNNSTIETEINGEIIGNLDESKKKRKKYKPRNKK